MSTHYDYGNNEGVTVGIFPEANGWFLAISAIDSRCFKTVRGATLWLAQRGYNADGTRIRPEVRSGT
jgi:hypothetical protein